MAQPMVHTLTPPATALQRRTARSYGHAALAGGNAGFSDLLARYAAIPGLGPSSAASTMAPFAGASGLSSYGDALTPAPQLLQQFARARAVGLALYYAMAQGQQKAQAAVAPAAPAAGTPPVASSVGTPPPGRMALADYPRPVNDNGRGLHWVPTLYQKPEVVDRFVDEAKAMHVKWIVLLNSGTNLTDNEYLVKKLVAAGIMPVMRIYTGSVAPIQGDIEALVRHYKELGVSYYQLFNEPNLIDENGGDVPNVDRYLDAWIPAAEAVTQAGGLPGFAALAPGGHYDDLQFFNEALDGIQKRGKTDVLRHAWIALHNYTLNHPVNYTEDSNGFLKFRWYDQAVRQRLGYSLPIISTEGGSHVGADSDNRFPKTDLRLQTEMVMDGFRYMKHAEPYYFAYNYWIIANETGGGTDGSFNHQALFMPGGPIPLVDALKREG